MGWHVKRITLIFTRVFLNSFLTQTLQSFPHSTSSGQLILSKSNMLFRTLILSLVLSLCLGMISHCHFYFYIMRNTSTWIQDLIQITNGCIQHKMRQKASNLLYHSLVFVDLHSTNIKRSILYYPRTRHLNPINSHIVNYQNTMTWSIILLSLQI